MNISQLLLEHFDHLLATPDSVEQLNQAILDLAVRGKLVPQDPTDEPASELLKRTQAQKAKLTEQGKLANNDSMLSIRESEKPFALPEGWAWARFGDITINRDGERIPVAKEDRESRQGEYDYYGASGVIDKVDSYLFDKSLLLIGEDGANLVNRSTPIAFIAHGKYWVNNHAHVLDAIDFAVLKYLEIYINAIDLKPYLTGTAQPKMNQAKMNSIVVAVPPFAEQHRIVARVEQLFAQTRQLAELLSKAQTDLTHLNAAALHHLLAADTPEDFNAQWDFIATHFDLLYSEPEHIAPLRQAILELAVRGNLTRQAADDEPASELLKRIQAEKARLVEAGEIRDSDPLPKIREEEKPFELLHGWEWARLGELARFIDYRGQTPEKTESGMRLITAKNVRMGYLSLEPQEYVDPDMYDAWMTRGIPQKDDVLFTTEAPLGNVAQLDTDERIVFAQRIVTLHSYQGINPKFLMQVLMSQPIRKLILDKSSGVTARGIKAKLLKTVIVPIPPLVEQQRIVARVEQLLGLCDALEAKLQAAQVEREKLVAAVVAGVAAPFSQ